MHPLVLIVFLPLLAAIVAGLFGRWIGKTASKVVTTAALFIGAFLSWPIFFHFIGGNAAPQVVPVLDWIHSGTMTVDWSLRLDSLTAVMLVVVTTVSSLVHLYSWGYMAEDPSQPRFFAYLSLFSFAMLMLVTADSLVQMFFGWEGVGLASYLLIGFWYYKPSANAAALKAFVVNRIGDFGFSLGIFATFLVFGTVSIPAILAAAPGMAGSTIGFAGMHVETMTLLCLLLFVGAMGKSAQLPLHTWLPDAMEGPTPVSALIHAATMVTAGVFMVCRLSPMFEVSETARTVVTYVGAATCIFAATIGCAQNDIKRVIAYSTCSQLGYMFFAAGVGAYGAAMFHLFTHAFFKALLFLGAGSVIHAMHHEQDMRFYGGLRKEIPITFWVMVAGTLAITGVGVAGIGFAGFWSKDAILESAWGSGSVSGTIAFWLGALAALLTSFYSWRVIFLTFFGQARWASSEHIQHAVHHVHEPEGSERHPQLSIMHRRTRRSPGLPDTIRTKARYDARADCLLALGASLPASCSMACSSMPRPPPASGAGRSRSASTSPMRRTVDPVDQAHADDRHADRPVDRVEQLYPQPGRGGPLRRDLPGITGSCSTNGISTSSTISCSCAPRCGSAACSGTSVIRASSTALGRTARRSPLPLATA